MILSSLLGALLRDSCSFRWPDSGGHKVHVSLKIQFLTVLLRTFDACIRHGYKDTKPTLGLLLQKCFSKTASSGRSEMSLRMLSPVQRVGVCMPPFRNALHSFSMGKWRCTGPNSHRRRCCSYLLWAGTCGLCYLQRIFFPCFDSPANLPKGDSWKFLFSRLKTCVMK